jgi:hypothetical protein
MSVLPPAPTTRRVALQILAVFVTLAVLAVGAVLAVRLTRGPVRIADITELDASMMVDRQDFPASTASFEGPEKSTDGDPDGGGVTPAICAALAGPPATQSMYVNQSSDSSHALAMRISLPYKTFDYIADAATCSGYQLGSGIMVDVDHQVSLDGLPPWAVAVTERVSDRGSMITPFAGRKVIGRYRGVYLVAICLRPTVEQLRGCDESLVHVFNAQVRKLASV